MRILSKQKNYYESSIALKCTNRHFFQIKWSWYRRHRNRIITGDTLRQCVQLQEVENIIVLHGKIKQRDCYNSNETAI